MKCCKIRCNAFVCRNDPAVLPQTGSERDANVGSQIPSSEFRRSPLHVTWIFSLILRLQEPVFKSCFFSLFAGNNMQKKRYYVFLTQYKN